MILGTGPLKDIAAALDMDTTQLLNTEEPQEKNLRLFQFQRLFIPFFLRPLSRLFLFYLKPDDFVIILFALRNMKLSLLNFFSA